MNYDWHSATTAEGQPNGREGACHWLKDSAVTQGLAPPGTGAQGRVKIVGRLPNGSLFKTEWERERIEREGEREKGRGKIHHRVRNNSGKQIAGRLGEGRLAVYGIGKRLRVSPPLCLTLSRVVSVLESQTGAEGNPWVLRGQRGSVREAGGGGCQAQHGGSCLDPGQETGAAAAANANATNGDGKDSWETQKDMNDHMGPTKKPKPPKLDAKVQVCQFLVPPPLSWSDGVDITICMSVLDCCPDS
ncbi:hypothetical protein JZ751_000481 [Albula glossodonta]|uniref:Uncharacterized protein n=1 Tax=Albula glossodonta TaxID=121402 RepID=A0A8T2PWC7_9TELE|nr:hypothetical protein JZ751_000481 [Albula glossodonta]